MTTCFCHRPDRNCEKCRVEAGRATYSVDTRTDAERERDRRMQADAVVTVSRSCAPDVRWIDGIRTVNCTGLPWEVALRQVLTDRADLLEELAVN